MSRWWTPAHDEAATHLAMKIKAAREAGDTAAEQQAWRELNDLHGVRFALVRLDAQGLMVGEPVMLSAQGDADACVQNLGVGAPPATAAVLLPCERPDQPLRTWRWDSATGAWAAK